VKKLKELPVLAADRIKQMVKESRPARSPKQQQESSVEWCRDNSGGGRHLQLNLYDDELNTKIKHTAEERQITAQEVIAEAFRKSELVEQAIRERREAINEVRSGQIEMQRQLIQKDERIKDLESILAGSPQVKGTKQVIKETKPAIYIQDFGTWEELAEAVNSQSDRFVAVMKLASTQERSRFVQLLSTFCEREPDALDRLDWVPPRFLDSALRYLSFSVSRFADTSLSEDPVMETIHGCKFLGFKELGTPSERWGFKLPNGTNIAIFERSRFNVEGF
jgi:hypothetical protein